MDTMSKPRVVKWFKVYCWILAVLYVLTIPMSLVFLIVSPEELEMPWIVARAVGGILLILDVLLITASLLGAFLSPRPWVWIYGLILICLGMTSACFLPICIPLLIFWIRQETKAYYGRTIPVPNVQ